MRKNSLVVQIYITDNCDQRCKHCYIFGADPNRKPNTMSVDDFKEAVNRCVEYSKRSNVKFFWELQEEILFFTLNFGKSPNICVIIN